jgi:hypothetical protein
MAGDKSILASLSVRPAGRRHRCRRNKKHLMLMGEGVLVVKEGRSELHYCVSCGKKFVDTARSKLDQLETQLAEF